MIRPHPLGRAVPMQLRFAPLLGALRHGQLAAELASCLSGKFWPVVYARIIRWIASTRSAIMRAPIVLPGTMAWATWNALL